MATAQKKLERHNISPYHCSSMSIGARYKNHAEIPRIMCNKKQARQAVKRQKKYIVYADHDYIVYEIARCYHIEYERKIHKYDKKE